MTGIVEFLTARLDEEQRLAEAAAASQGSHWHDESGMVSSETESADAPGHYLDSYASGGRWALWDCEGSDTLGVTAATSAHMSYNDPARVLADVAAKRRIIAGYEDAKHHYEQEHDVDGSVKYSDGAVWAFLDKLEVWEQVIRLLALPYRDHPDFDPSWGQQ